MNITYRGYTISSTETGVFSIERDGDVIDTAETLSAAKTEVDGWMQDDVR